MAKRENKLLGTLKSLKKDTPSVSAPAANNPEHAIDEKGLNKFLVKIGEKPFSDGSRQTKVQTCSFFPDDIALLQQYRRKLEEETDALNIPVSKIIRAALHAVHEDDLIQAYLNLNK